MQPNWTFRHAMPNIRIPGFRRPQQNVLPFAVLCCLLILLNGCRASRDSGKPSIHFIQVPRHVSIGGPADLDPVRGTVSGSKPGEKIMIYSLTEGTWWVQPFRSRAFTEIAGDGSWSNVSHLGSQYAALLVNENHQVSARLTSLPAVGGDVLAVAFSPGDSNRPPDPKPLHFSGYDWKVRSGGGDIGGALCDYQAPNAWVDDKGYLHLLMGEQGGDWHCAGVTMAHSLGYGTYRFVVADSAHFPPSAILDMFMRPDHEDPDERSGFSIALT